MTPHFWKEHVTFSKMFRVAVRLSTSKVEYPHYELHYLLISYELSLNTLIKVHKDGVSF